MFEFGPKNLRFDICGEDLKKKKIKAEWWALRLVYVSCIYIYFSIVFLCTDLDIVNFFSSVYNFFSSWILRIYANSYFLTPNKFYMPFNHGQSSSKSEMHKYLTKICENKLFSLFVANTYHGTPKQPIQLASIVHIRVTSDAKFY